ncbi:MAG: hypothetical protein AAFP77_25400 [Bacteroidota bacterium]
MNQRHPLDELFNQHLRNASAPVPEDMWSRIAQARQQKRRRLFVIWSSVGSASLTLLAAIWMFSSGPDLGSFPLSVPEQVSPPRSSVAEIRTNTQEVAAPTFEGQSTSTAQENDSNLGLPSAAAEPAPAVQQTTQTPAIGQTFALSGTTNTLNQTTTPQETNNLALSGATDNTIAVTEEPMATANSVSVVEEKSASTRVAGPHQRQTVQIVDMLPEKGFHLAKQAEIKLFANHAPRCADFAAPFFRLDLEMLGGPAYAHQTLKAKTSESLDHLRQRQDSESAGVSYTGGFRLAASSNVGLGLRTGLMYTQINDRFTFNVGSRMDVSVIFGPNGEVIRTDTVYTEGYEDTRRNKLQFVEIPLLLGYERQWGKLRVGVNAGAVLNLYFGAKGAIYSPATAEAIDFGQQGDRDVLPIFERQATAAWYAGLSLAYNLHSRYSVIAEPYFKTYPQALSSGAYDLQQNYWLTGMQLGMRMRL